MTSEISKITFIDLETGGPNPDRHPIIQLAAAAVDGATLAILETVEIKVRFDERKAAKYALRKNSYSRRVWHQQALSEHEAAQTFADFLRRHATFPVLSQDGAEFRLAQLVAHNATFDAAFLHAWYERLKIFCPARHQVLCTLQRSLWHFFENPSRTPPHNFKLETLCHHFGISFSAAEAHDALGDVRATVALYKALVARLATIPYPTAA
ncbi:MAG: 3'-5' exonuclease [Planctomycetes bacterium]|nr:3'-5' exonuclease [Planctomycetota bacterium]